MGKINQFTSFAPGVRNASFQRQSHLKYQILIWVTLYKSEDTFYLKHQEKMMIFVQFEIFLNLDQMLTQKMLTHGHHYIWQLGMNIGELQHYSIHIELKSMPKPTTRELVYRLILMKQWGIWLGLPKYRFFFNYGIGIKTGIETRLRN